MCLIHLEIHQERSPIDYPHYDITSSSYTLSQSYRLLSKPNSFALSHLSYILFRSLPFPLPLNNPNSWITIILGLEIIVRDLLQSEVEFEVTFHPENYTSPRSIPFPSPALFPPLHTVRHIRSLVLFSFLFLGSPRICILYHAAHTSFLFLIIYQYQVDHRFGAAM